jgi:hypothetical protein
LGLVVRVRVRVRVRKQGSGRREEAKSRVYMVVRVG